MSERDELYKELLRRTEMLLGYDLSPAAPVGSHEVTVEGFRIKAHLIAWQTKPAFTINTTDTVILNQINDAVNNWTRIENEVLPALRKATILEDLADV